MYLYLLIVTVAVFGAWFLGGTQSLPRRAASPGRRQERFACLTPQEKAAEWKNVGKLLVVAAVVMGMVICTSNYSDGRTKAGIAAYNQGRYAAAETALSQANNFNPRGAEPHYYLGLCFLHDGKKDAAIREFQSVCSIVAHKRRTYLIEDQYAQEAQAQLQQLGAKS